MKHIHRESVFSKTDSVFTNFFSENTIFFDIETTGFSPAHAQIYMIGCVSRCRNDQISVDQFFAETRDDEASVLRAFCDRLKGYCTLVTFNGTGFDLPFIQAKCEFYGISLDVSRMQMIDLFKAASQIKNLLKLEHYNQKSIEQFLGIRRDDQFDGGELIQVYRSYLHTQSSEDARLLLLHNYEDLIGMTELLPILAYRGNITGEYNITDVREHPYLSYDNEEKSELIITVKNEYTVPIQVSFQQDGIYISMNKNLTKIRVPVLSGELYYFFENYKDYYYLPMEDMAVHKSVAGFVDKKYRTQAKASNCYTRKQGTFLPQHTKLFTPAFQSGYKSKIFYFELDPQFLQKKLQQYVRHIMQLI